MPERAAPPEPPTPRGGSKRPSTPPPSRSAGTGSGRRKGAFSRPGRRARRASSWSFRRPTSPGRSTSAMPRPHARGRHRALEADAGTPRLWVPGHRPRRHRDADGGRAPARGGGHQTAARWAARPSSSASGSGSARPADTIQTQMMRLGARCDWTRERFTLDPDLSRAVRESSSGSTNEGLIYRGEYIVNWCPRCGTARLRSRGRARRGRRQALPHPLPTCRASPRARSSPRRGPRRCWATRPSRSIPRTRATATLRGKTAILPLMDREIPIIEDAILVDREFGTGVVKVTPAHDANDFASRRAARPARRSTSSARRRR